MEDHYEKIRGGEHMRLVSNDKQRLCTNDVFQHDVIHDLGGARSCHAGTPYVEHNRHAQFERRQWQHG